MQDSPLPRYVERGGELVARPPYSYFGTRLFGFVVKAERRYLFRLLERYLNEPSRGAVHFRPATDRIMICFVDMAMTVSSVSEDAVLGSLDEQEALIWILANDATRPGSLYVFVPYAFVSAALQMAGGREVYGFPKQLGYVSIPGNGAPPTQFTLETRGTPPSIGPNPLWQTLPLITVRQTQHVDGWQPAPRWWQFQDVIHEATQLLRVSDPNMDADVARLLLAGQAPMVFLKQFRDVADPTGACYQAIVEANAHITTFRYGGLLPGTYQVQIEELDNEPIRRELGLHPGPMESELSFWLDFDFQMETGRVVWSAGTTPPTRVVIRPDSRRSR